MKTSMEKNAQDFSSKRPYHWTAKVSNEDDDELISFKSTLNISTETEKDKNKVVLPLDDVPIFKTSLTTIEEEKKEKKDKQQVQESAAGSDNPARRKLQVAVSRLRLVLAAFGKNRGHFQQGLGSRVVGTLFGYRRGHVHFTFQKDSTSPPVLLIELATPITGLVKEMASGLVRIALECDKEEEKKGTRLLEEPIWRTYCNGKKCGFAARRECGPKELKILKAVEPISMGAGVLPGDGDGDKGADSDGDIMYMRAKFERVVGSKDSEAFYMMNPDSNGAAELSIYLLRV